MEPVHIFDLDYATHEMVHRLNQLTKAIEKHTRGKKVVEIDMVVYVANVGSEWKRNDKIAFSEANLQNSMEGGAR